MQSLTLKFKGKRDASKKGGKGNGTFMLLSKLTHLIEKSFWKLLETLSAHETLFMVQLAITVYNLLGGRKTPPAALTSGVSKGIGHVAVTQRTGSHGLPTFS